MSILAFKHNAAIYGRSGMAAFVRVFAQKMTARGVPQHGLVRVLWQRTIFPRNFAIFLEPHRVVIVLDR
jgi:hypothetical protein